MLYEVITANGGVGSGDAGDVGDVIMAFDVNRIPTYGGGYRLVITSYSIHYTKLYEAGGGHGLRLDRLLVKPGLFTISLIKAVGTDGHKMPSQCVRPLQIGQPTERLQPGFGHGLIGDPLAAHELV